MNGKAWTVVECAKLVRHYPTIGASLKMAGRTKAAVRQQARKLGLKPLPHGWTTSSELAERYGVHITSITKLAGVRGWGRVIGRYYCFSPAHAALLEAHYQPENRIRTEDAEGWYDSPTVAAILGISPRTLSSAICPSMRVSPRLARVRTVSRLRSYRRAWKWNPWQVEQLAREFRRG